jgi:hypothetical protein
METTMPPREKPLMACPIAPQTPATTSNRRNSITVMEVLLSQHKLPAGALRWNAPVGSLCCSD